MKNKTWIFISILVGFVILSTYSCKKESNGGEDPNKGAPSIRVESSNVYQLEIVTLIAKNIAFKQNIYTGTIEGKSIEIRQVNDTLLAFMMPVVASGSQKLILQVESKDYTISFNLLPSPQIDNPASYISDFIKQIKIQDNNPTDLEIKKSLDDALLQFNSLTPLQQKEAVDFIAANRSALDEVNSLLNNHVLKSTNGDCANEVYRTSHMKCVVLDYMVCLARLSAPVVVLGLAGSAFSPLGTFIGGMTGILFVKAFMKKTLRRSGTLWEEFIDNTFIPFKASLAPSKSISFVNGTAKGIVFNLQINNIQNTNYTQGWLSNLVKSYKKFKALWEQTIDEEPVPGFAALKQETVNSDNFGFVSLKILDNTNVTGTLGGTVDNLTITFSTTKTTEQNFNFEITYNDGDFKVSSLNSAVLTLPNYKLGYLDGNTVPNTVIPFEREKATFFILLNDNGTAAAGIDYNQISIANNTNSKITVRLTPLPGINGSFAIDLKSAEATSQTTSFDVLYKSKKVQTIQATLYEDGEWYAGYYTLNHLAYPGTPNPSDYTPYYCGSQYGQQGEVYFYLNSSKQVAFARSIMPNIPDLWDVSYDKISYDPYSWMVFDNYGKFSNDDFWEFDLGPLYVNSGISIVPDNRIHIGITDISSWDKSRCCDPTIGYVYVYRVDPLAPYIGHTPPPGLSKEEVQKMLDL